jgi:PAS domain S-box-containing protein
MRTPEDVTKEDLIRDLTRLRERISELEQSQEDKRKFQEELSRTKAMFEGLFELAPDAIIVVSRNGGIVRANKRAEQLFGYSRDELLNAHHEILLPERLREKHLEHRRVYMSEPHIRPMGTGLELFGRRKDGSEFSVDIALGPLKAEEDMVVIAVIRDVSKRKEEADMMKKRTSELIEAMKELDAFSYSVSHDLRAPLRQMHGFVELLKKRIVDLPDEKIHHYADAIAAASIKMGILVDDLLAFSRMGRTEIKKRKIGFNILVREVIQDIQDEVKGRNIKWEIDELPEVVYGDQALLRLVLVNLISNSVKFTRVRTQAEIRIGCKDEEDKFICLVNDNGVGFDMKYVDKLFGVFQRLHTQDEFEGTGVGLANVRRIISRHGGKIWAEGSVGQGATFYFTLPKTKEIY